MSEFYKLSVSKVEALTADSVAVSFDVPADLKEAFIYKPGQFLTLGFNLNGEDVRRSYSLCSTPAKAEPLQVGVKRVPKGLVSNHINGQVKAGDVVEVMAPDGVFCADVAPDNHKTYYLFAAGSGITPILSILQTVLLTEQNSKLNLLYGNRNAESVMFGDQIKALQAQYGDRFTYEQAMSKPKGGGLGGLFKKKASTEFRKGRIDHAMVKWFVESNPSSTSETAYYICGPGTMIENTQKALLNLNISDDKIFMESFGTAAAEDKSAGVAGAKLIAHVYGETHEVTVPKNRTVLRALIEAGVDVPFSCEGGVCSTCVCQLKSGSVTMMSNMALDESEVAAGAILACQSLPTTESIEVEYD